MSFYVTVPINSVNPAQTALNASFGDRITQSILPRTVNPSQYDTIQIDTSDSTLTADDISSVITNALGVYTTASTSAPGGIGSLDLGSFLNSIGNWFANLKLPSLNLPNIWFLIFAALALLLVFVFAAETGRGLGGGLAAKV